MFYFEYVFEDVSCWQMYEIFYIKAPKRHQFTAYCTRLLHRINHTICVFGLVCVTWHAAKVLWNDIQQECYTRSRSIIIVHNWPDWISRERNSKVNTRRTRGWSIICKIKIECNRVCFGKKDSLHLPIRTCISIFCMHLIEKYEENRLNCSFSFCHHNWYMHIIRWKL